MMLENPGTSPVSFEAWVDVALPNGTSYGPILGPVPLTLAGGGSITDYLTKPPESSTVWKSIVFLNMGLLE